MEKVIIGFKRQNGQLECKGATNLRELVKLDSKLFAPKDGESEYTDCNGNLTGITQEMVESGIGSYDDGSATYYTSSLESLDKDEWTALFEEEGNRPSSLEEEMIAYLEEENNITIKGKKLTLSLKALREKLDSDFYSQEEFEQEFTEEDND